MTYDFPKFLNGLVAPAAYSRWLQRKASAHARRDRKRGNTKATISSYKKAIHAAVVAGNGKDEYTGEQLNWSLISRYDNNEAKSRGRTYKKELALLPTVDHIGDGLGTPDFVICSWRTNDAKHDLTLEEFLTLCSAVLKHHGYVVTTDHDQYKSS